MCIPPSKSTHSLSQPQHARGLGIAWRAGTPSGADEIESTLLWVKWCDMCYSVHLSRAEGPFSLCSIFKWASLLKTSKYWEGHLIFPTFTESFDWVPFCFVLCRHFHGDCSGSFSLRHGSSKGSSNFVLNLACSHHCGFHCRMQNVKLMLHAACFTILIKPFAVCLDFRWCKNSKGVQALQLITRQGFQRSPTRVIWWLRYMSFLRSQIDYIDDLGFWSIEFLFPLQKRKSILIRSANRACQSLTRWAISSLYPVYRVRVWCLILYKVVVEGSWKPLIFLL